MPMELSQTSLPQRLLSEWTSSLTGFCEEFSIPRRSNCDSNFAAHLEIGSDVIVRIAISKKNFANYKVLIGEGWEKDTEYQNRFKERLEGYSQIDDGESDGDTFSKLRNLESEWRDIYVTAKIVTCDWRDPEICTGTAIVAFTAAPYCPLTTITTNAESDENQNAALISILGESQYFKTNMMNIYAFNESHAGIGHLSLETDEIIVMRRKECGKVSPVKLTGIPATHSSSALSRGCYFPCSLLRTESSHPPKNIPGSGNSDQNNLRTGTASGTTPDKGFVSGVRPIQLVLAMPEEATEITSQTDQSSGNRSILHVLPSDCRISSLPHLTQPDTHTHSEGSILPLGDFLALSQLLLSPPISLLRIWRKDTPCTGIERTPSKMLSEESSDAPKGTLTTGQNAAMVSNISKSGVKTKKGEDQLGEKKDQSLLNEWRSELRRIIASDFHQKKKAEGMKAAYGGEYNEFPALAASSPYSPLNTPNHVVYDEQSAVLKAINEGKGGNGVTIQDSINYKKTTPHTADHPTIPRSAMSTKFLACVNEMMTSMQGVSTELLADVRADRLDRDTESLQHITRLMEGKSSASGDEEKRRDQGRGNDEGKGNGGDTQNGFNDKHETPNLSYSVRARSVLDANAVSLCQESIVLNPRDILRRCKAVFLQAEQLFSIVTSHIELMTPTVETPGYSQNNPQDLQSAEKVKDCLAILVNASCTAVECVCTVLYVFPTPFTVSTKEWGVATSCFLDCRSAAVHVLTVCLAYNNAVKTLNRPHPVEKGVLDQTYKQERKGVLSIRLLESVLSDMEVIMAEEVEQSALQSIGMMFRSHFMDDVIRQEWQSNSAFRKDNRISHGISALILTLRGMIYDCLSSLPHHTYFCGTFCMKILVKACRSVFDIYSALTPSRVRLQQWGLDVRAVVYASLQTLKMLQSKCLSRPNIACEKARQKGSVDRDRDENLHTENEHYNRHSQWTQRARISCLKTSRRAALVLHSLECSEIVQRIREDPTSCISIEPDWSEEIQDEDFSSVMDVLLSLMCLLFIRHSCPGARIIPLLSDFAQTDRATNKNKIKTDKRAATAATVGPIQPALIASGDPFPANSQTHSVQSVLTIDDLHGLWICRRVQIPECTNSDSHPVTGVTTNFAKTNQSLLHDSVSTETIPFLSGLELGPSSRCWTRPPQFDSTRDFILFGGNNGSYGPNSVRTSIGVTVEDIMSMTVCENILSLSLQYVSSSTSTSSSSSSSSLPTAATSSFFSDFDPVKILPLLLSVKGVTDAVCARYEALKSNYPVLTLPEMTVRDQIQEYVRVNTSNSRVDTTDGNSKKLSTRSPL